jgi:hypothetical protein
MNTTTYYSNYNYNLSFGENKEEDSFDWKASIQNLSVKTDLTWYLNANNTITFGGQAIYYTFTPSDAIGVSRGKITDISLAKQFASENAIYLENEQRLWGRLNVKYGLRVSSFAYLGGATVYTYEGEPGNYKRKPIAEKKYNTNEIIKAYVNPEPRLAFNYSLSENSSVKLSYNRMAQYVHLISNTVSSVPIDIYTPSTNNIKPQICDQYSTGYFRNFMVLGGLETSAEVFYKNMTNQIDYIDGANLRFNKYMEGELIAGKGRAYGLEVYVKKTEGRFTGWVSYTLSKTERIVNGINNSEWYPTKYNRTNNLSVVGIYNLNKRWKFASTFTFASGTPFTFQDQKYQIQGYTNYIISNESRNNLLMPAYHRLDFSATLVSKERERKTKIFKYYSWELVFGIYNVYGRKNAFAIISRQDPNDPANSIASKFALFGAAIPAFTYNFKF